MTEPETDPLTSTLRMGGELSAGQAERALQSLIEKIAETLLSGGELRFQGLFSLHVEQHRARVARDPETGHQVVAPAENHLSIELDPDFRERLRHSRLSSILLALWPDDFTAEMISFHFSRFGWRVHRVASETECQERLRDSGVKLVIVDSSLPYSTTLIERIKISPATNRISVIVLYPSGAQPDTSTRFRVRGDEYLVEPFEVQTLLRLAEAELTRGADEATGYLQQLRFQFPTRPSEIAHGLELATRLCAEASFPEAKRIALDAAVREAIGNAAQHGNRNLSSAMIRVLFTRDREKVSVLVSDQGPGFDHEGMLARGPDREPSPGFGLGLALMRRCVDRLEFNEAGNAVELVKFF